MPEWPFSPAGLGRQPCRGPRCSWPSVGVPRPTGPSRVSIPAAVERPIDESVALIRHVGDDHADLVAGDLAGRACMLAMYATGRLALLQEAGLVDDQHRLRIGQALHRVGVHHIARGICIPAPKAEDRPLTPGTNVTRRFGPHSPGLASLVSHQTIRECAGRGSDALLREQWPDAPLHLPQSRGP